MQFQTRSYCQLTPVGRLLSPHPDSDNMCLDPDSLSQSGGEGLEDGVQYSVWVSYYEIYNEFLYDLLEAAPTSMLKKRSNLKLSDDRQGNPYVKGKGC